ncbi:MAG: PAS domain S-box protein, partial [Hyphomicrobium sp.]
PVRSYLAAPVISRSGAVIGGLFFGHPEPGVFDARAESILVGIAAQAAIALDNSRLFRSAQEELRERRRAEEVYRTLVEMLPQLLWTCSPDGKCDRLSRQWLEYTGIAEAEQLGYGWLERAIHPSDRARVYEHWMGAVWGQHDYDIDFRIRRYDGVYRWFKTRASPARDEAGKIVQWSGSSTDIEDIVAAREMQASLRADLERKVAQRTEELGAAYARLVAESSEREVIEGRFQLLVEGVTDYALFMLDVNGIVTNWNAGAERIKGYRADEIIGQHFSRFHTEEDRINGLPQRSLTTAAGEGKFETEGWRVRKDGTRLWANVVINAIYDRSGKLVGFAKITRDVTEQRAAEAALRQAQDQLTQAQKMEGIGQLTGGVAHDFNNLLTIIIGNLGSIQRSLSKSVDRERLLRLAGNAMQGAERAASLTQRLLAFSRRQPLNPEPVDVGRLVGGMTDLLRRTLNEEIAFETALADGLWQVNVDSNQLEVSLLNLVVNARDAMPDGGRLTIETANATLDAASAERLAGLRPGRYVVISLTDTGTGMTDEVLAHAFEPFFTTKDVGHGTGLGLSQVYGFVKQSGGQVRIYTRPGEGTTVKIYLPRSTSELPVALPVPPPDGRAHAPASETILLVEDEENVRTYSRDILSELGYAVIDAPDGHAALRLLDLHPEVHLLFTDVGLPKGMNGRQLADEARRRRPALKVLFTTGYARDPIVHDGTLDPGIQLIIKPFGYEALAVKLRDVLGRPPG